jgi:hypothetical protein
MEFSETDRKGEVHSRNPVRRGWVKRPDDWMWISFRSYLTGEIRDVEVESQWTQYRREKVHPRPTAHFVNRRTGHRLFPERDPLLRFLLTDAVLAWETAHQNYTSSEAGLEKDIPLNMRPPLAAVGIEDVVVDTG